VSRQKVANRKSKMIFNTHGDDMGRKYGKEGFVVGYKIKN
jgi:hypothetical protein